MVNSSRFLVLFSILVAGAQAASFTVNSVDDAVDAAPGNGKCDTGVTIGGVPRCTLRAALMEANALSGAHTVTVPAGTYTLRIYAPCAYASNGFSESFTSLCITGNVTLNGAGADRTILDANTSAFYQQGSGAYNRSSGIVIGATANTTITGLKIINGQGLGGVTEARGGAAILNNYGVARLSNLIVTNHNGNPGGVITNTRTMSMENIVVTNNSNANNLGAVVNSGGLATLTMNNSTVSGNGTTGVSTGSGRVYITNSTLSGNSGSGVNTDYYPGDANFTSITNSTVSGNQSPGPGGGITSNSNGGMIELNNVTVAFNTAGIGSAGVVATNLVIKNSVIAKNIGGYQQYIGPPIVGEFNCASQNLKWSSQGYNIFGTQVDCGPLLTAGPNTDRFGLDPMLTPLNFNSGLTQTHALGPASPAIDAGNPAAPGVGNGACASNDQRGILRPQGSRCDIGAVERDRGFVIFGVTPNQGGSGATLLLNLSGGGFVPGAVVTLRRGGQPDIPVTQLNVDGGGASMFGAVDFGSATAGVYDVAVLNGDGTAGLLPNAFTLAAPKAPEIYSMVVGRSAVRAGVAASFQVVVGNKGNVEARNVPLAFSTPGYFALTLGFDVSPPPPQPGQVRVIDPAGYPIVVFPYSHSGVLNVPLLIPVIPGNSTVTYRFTLLLPPSEPHGSEFSFSVTPGEPILNNPAAIPQLVDGAVAYANANYGVTVPGSALPSVQAYAAGLLDRTVSEGRSQLIASSGAYPAIYSLGQLSIDLARYAASLVPGANLTSTARIGEIERRLPAPRGPVAPVADGQKGCKGQILAEGQSCEDNKNPLPTPDPGKPDPGGIHPGDCRAMPNHHISSDGSTCVPDDRRGCPLLPNVVLGTDPRCGVYPIKNSVDPNEKVGPAGGGVAHARRSEGALSYQISFENLSTASAAAQLVTVTDAIDMSVLDIDTVTLGPISFGNTSVVPPPGLISYQKILDMRPAGNYLVQINGALNKASGVLTWVFRTLDPFTGQATTDPDLGFLPPNRTAPEGSGSVSISAKPTGPVRAGATICNQASIVFDFNAPIGTGQYCNTMDDTAPVSRVNPLAAQQSANTFAVNWGGADVGSSIGSYDVFVSVNGGAYRAWQQATALTQANYTGAAGSRYSFYSVATDLAGNVEAAKTTAEATTSLAAATTCAAAVNGQFSIVAGGLRLNNATGRFQQIVNITRTASGPLSGPFALALSGLSANATLYQPGGTTACAASGLPYVLVSPGTSWATAQSVAVTLEFTNPTRAAINWNPLLLNGTTY